MGAAEHNFNIYNSLILAGIVQGFIFGIVVFCSKKYRATSTLLLGALILVFSLNNLQYYLSSAWIVKNRYLYGYSWTPGQLVMGPLLVFYGLKLLYPEKPLSKTTVRLLLLPFLLGLVAVTYTKIQYRYLDDKPVYMLVEAVIEFTSIILSACTIGWLILETRKVQRKMKFDLSVVSPKLQWFRNILVTFFALSWVWLAVALDMVVNNAPQEVWYVIWIALSVMIYWIGHVGIYKYGIEEERKNIRSYSIEHRANYTPAKQKNEHIAALEQLLVGQRQFLDPTLTLDKVADELKISKSHLSRIINTELGVGFPDYLNALRVEEAKSYLNNPDFANYTLVAIGLEAGFNSKTTFNTVFKKITLQTPSEFRNAHAASEVQNRIA